MGLLEELKEKSLLGELKEQRERAVRLASEHRGDGEHSFAMADAIDAKIADLDRAIAALTPAQPSQSEEAKPDALAEFMKRERAVKWMGGDCPFPIGTYVVMLHRDGTEQGRYITHSDDYSGDYAWGRSDFGHREDDIVAFIDPQLATTKQQKGDDSEPLGCFEPGSGDGEESDALAEFMKREGAVKWGGGDTPGNDGPAGFDTLVEVLWENGKITRAQSDCYSWRVEPGATIIAYRVLPSEPAAEAKGEGAAEPAAPGIPYEGFAPAELNAEEDNLSSMEKEYLWAFCGLIEPKPWGAAMSAIMECLAGHRLIEGESDATPTKLGRAVGEWSFYLKDHPKSPDTITISASEQHAEESARAQSLPPLLPPEPPPAATPEQLIEAGAINGEAYGLWRKMAKEPA